MTPVEALLALKYRQYREFKADNPHTLILLRVGDFYEAYDADARTLARELELTLSSRQVPGEHGLCSLTGVPYHVIDRASESLRRAGLNFLFLHTKDEE